MASNFRTDIKAFIDENLSPPARSKALAATAIAERDKLILSGDASPRFSTFVDGRRDDGGESHVKGDGGGVIAYKFSMLADAIAFALAFLRLRVPRVSGLLSESFWVSINDVFSPPGTGIDYANIPSDAQVVIGNVASYWRKAEMALSGNRILRYRAPHPLDDCVSAISRQFGRTAIKAQRLANYQFPNKYSPVVSKGRRPYTYSSPVIIITGV